MISSKTNKYVNTELYGIYSAQFAVALFKNLNLFGTSAFPNFPPVRTPKQPRERTQRWGERCTWTHRFAQGGDISCRAGGSRFVPGYACSCSRSSARAGRRHG